MQATLADRKKLMVERLIDLRKARGWTRLQTARHCNVSYRGYCYIEDGVSWPTSDTLIQICEGLNATPDYLLGFDDEET